MSMNHPEYYENDRYCAHNILNTTYMAILSATTMLLEPIAAYICYVVFSVDDSI